MLLVSILLAVTAPLVLNVLLVSIKDLQIKQVVFNVLLGSIRWRVHHLVFIVVRVSLHQRGVI